MHATYKNNKFETTSCSYILEDGHYECYFEGGLINEQALRKQLEKRGVYFSSACIEKVLLELYRFCGDDFIALLQGKFSIIIIDEEKQQLIAARDRYGIRPLYYQLVDEGVELATELAHFKAHLDEEFHELNMDVLKNYFSCGYVPEEDTYLKGVYQVPAGCVLRCSMADGVEITPFSDMLVIEGSYHELIDEQLLYEVVTKSIHSRLPANQVVGIFDTGKIEDLVLASIVKQAGIEVKVFSVTFGKKSRNNKSFEDTFRCRGVCAHDYWNAAVAMVSTLGIPLADPTAPLDYLLFELASKQVDVILSSNGAAVLFDAKKRWSAHFKRRSGDLIFTEADKDKMLKIEGGSWDEFIKPYLTQISDLDKVSRRKTLNLNTTLKGSTILKTERFAMSHGLETSFPFLDDEVLGVASFLTLDQKREMNLFKQTFANHIYKSQTVGTKKGYEIPLASWMRSDLYEAIEAVLSQEVATEFFDTEYLLMMLAQHKKGLRDLSGRIWAVAMFIVWVSDSRKSAQ